MKRAPHYLLTLTLLLTGCGRGSILGGESLANSDPCAKGTCQTPIDRAVQDEFTCRLTPIEYATDAELCRRMFVDLAGTVPTPAEYAATCQGKTLEAIADDLMNRDTYILTRQRMWADRFGYNDTRSWYRNLAELDALVGQLYRGEIDFKTFVSKGAISPGLISRDEADGRVEAVFHAFMRRSPTADELSDFANLYRIYSQVIGTDPDIADFRPQRVQVLPCRCAGARRVQCQATLLSNEDVTLPLRFPQAADCQAEAGNTFLYEDSTNDEKLIQEAAGRVLISRPDIYRAQVIEAMTRFLGYDPSVAFPAIQDELERTLFENGSLRDIEKAVMTSVLYRQTSEPKTASVDCNGNPSRLFAGPRRLMSAEVQLDAMSKATGHSYGRCDHRMQVRSYMRKVTGAPDVESFAPSNLVYLYPLADPISFRPDYAYRERALLLGGCPDQLATFRQDEVGPFRAVSLDRWAREACEDPAATGLSGAVDGSDASLATLAADQFQKLFLRTPSEQESAMAVTAMRGCLDGEESCTTANVAARMCSAWLKSPRFMTF